MPSGRTVVIQANCRIFRSLHCFFTVTICVHPEDMFFSQGLCGNYNDIKSDDIVPKDLTDPDPNFFEPVVFSSSYMYVEYSQQASVAAEFGRHGMPPARL